MPQAVNRSAAGPRGSDSSSASSRSSSQGGEDMSTLTSLPREVLKWLLSLNLSYTVRNLKRDFSNGFLFAEILSRYYPNDVTLHSFENVISIERKRANWVVLAKLFKRRQIPIDQVQINAIISAEGDAATSALLTLHKFINSSAYSASLAPAGSSTLRGTQQQQQQQHQHLQHMSSQHHHQHHHSTAGGALSRSHSRGVDRAAEGDPDAAYHGGGTLEEQQWYAQQLMWQQQMYAAQGGYPPPPAAAEGAGAMAHGMIPYYQQMQAYAAAMQQQAWAYEEGADEQAVGDKAAVPDELAYSRAPRAVDYQPYSLKDYTERNYDVKRAGYWQLGKLGPDLESSELQAKRERNALIKELGRRIHEANQSSSSSSQGIGATSTSGRGTTAAAAPAAPFGGGGGTKGRGAGAKGELASCRERAAMYASSIPRPEPKKAPSRKTLAVGGQQESSSTPAAASSKSQGGGSGAAAAAGSGASAAGAAAVAATSSQKRLQQLVSQHDKDAQQVEAIMAEMQGLMAVTR